jgi:hypothetical protein
MPDIREIENALVSNPDFGTENIKFDRSQNRNQRNQDKIG